MYNLIVIRLVLFVVFSFLSGMSPISSFASGISIQYDRPVSDRYMAVYKVLKRNHQAIYGESIKYFEGLYQWPTEINILVTSCGTVNSRYIPDQKTIVICYESLYRKIYDYAENASDKSEFRERVIQNVMFTFWHELGHALIDQYGLANHLDRKSIESLADEFAVLSMLWREDSQWKDILMISALHFKSKSNHKKGETYVFHPSDEFRYQKMIVLLYGFAQKSYSNLEKEVDHMEWLTISAEEYYLERSAFWEENLRKHTKRDFFNN